MLKVAEGINSRGGIQEPEFRSQKEGGCAFFWILDSGFWILLLHFISSITFFCSSVIGGRGSLVTAAGVEFRSQNSGARREVAARSSEFWVLDSGGRGSRVM